jgi:ribosomal-protein-alanine N-acetyltransferase
MIGYWIDREYSGRGIGSAAVAHAVSAAKMELGLHGLQAAPSYLKIAGSWQDHVLFQRVLE